jgi:hypothetical protein
MGEHAYAVEVQSDFLERFEPGMCEVVAAFLPDDEGF